MNSTPLTLSKKYLLRKSVNNRYYIYNTETEIKYTITYKLFFIINIFCNNVLTLDQIYTFLRNQDIKYEDFILFLEKEEFADLLIESKDQFIQEDFYSNKKPLTDFTEFSPNKIDFLITKHCNLSCKHCFENSSSKHPIVNHSKGIIKNLFDSFDRIHLQTLKITGGEPFTVPYIDDLIMLLPDYRFECIILTNGILLNENRIKAIKDSDIRLGISLDGIDAASHDFLRGKGAFDLLYKNLKQLRNNDVKFSMTISLNKMNFRSVRELADIILNDFGARQMFINQLKPLGRAKKFFDIFISDEEYKRINLEYESLTDKYGNRVILSDDSNIYSQDSENDNSDDKIYCAAGNTTFALNENLDVYPCIYGFDNSEYKIGNLRQTDIEEIWISPKWDIFRGKTTLQNLYVCRGCSLNKLCSLKNCRLKPVYEGLDFFSPVSYCKASQIF